MSYQDKLQTWYCVLLQALPGSHLPGISRTGTALKIPQVVKKHSIIQLFVLYVPC